MTTFRNGDVCTIKVVVDSVIFEANDIKCIRVKIDGDTVYVDPAALTMVRPQFEVGDHVEWGVDLEWCGHILSIAEDHAWISRGGGGYATVWLPNLRRLDPEPKPAAVTATESTYVAMQAAISAAEEAQPIPDLEPRVPRFDGESGEAE